MDFTAKTYSVTLSKLYQFKSNTLNVFYQLFWFPIPPTLNCLLYEHSTNIQTAAVIPLQMLNISVKSNAMF